MGINTSQIVLFWEIFVIIVFITYTLSIKYFSISFSSSFLSPSSFIICAIINEYLLSKSNSVSPISFVNIYAFVFDSIVNPNPLFLIKFISSDKLFSFKSKTDKMKITSEILSGLINIFSDLKPIFLSEFSFSDQNCAKSAKK